MRKYKMFEALVEAERKSTKKWFFFSVSILIHSFLLGAILIVPLLDAGEQLPAVKIETIMVVSPPAAPPPPPASKKTRSGARQESVKQEGRDKPKPISDGRLIAPIEIPTEIEDDDELIDLGLDSGSDTGVDGGVEGLDAADIGPVFYNKKDSDPGSATEIRVSHVEKPRLIRRVAPDYPKIARVSRAQGIVVVEAVTDIYGRVIKARVISGHALLRNPALAAVKKWVYEPYIINGIPKPVVFTVTVTFKLD